MTEKLDDNRLEHIDSKHSHSKLDGTVSIHDPSLNDAEQLVHDHDEFTPQEYKRLMLKVDLILMPMLMISESRPAYPCARLHPVICTGRGPARLDFGARVQS